MVVRFGFIANANINCCIPSGGLNFLDKKNSTGWILRIRYPIATGFETAWFSNFHL